MAGRAERLAKRADEERAHGVWIAELEFRLGGMDIHIHLLRRHRQEQREHGIASSRDEVAVSGAHGARDQPVAHRSPVHHEIGLHAVWPMERRKAGKAFDGQGIARGGDGQSILDEIGSKDAAETREPVVHQAWRARLEAQRRALSIGEREGDFRMGEREPLHLIGDGGCFGPLGLHEFEASGVA